MSEFQAQEAAARNRIATEYRAVQVALARLSQQANKEIFELRRENALLREQIERLAEYANQSSRTSTPRCCCAQHAERPPTQGGRCPACPKHLSPRTTPTSGGSPGCGSRSLS